MIGLAKSSQRPEPGLFTRILPGSNAAIIWACYHTSRQARKGGNEMDTLALIWAAGLAVVFIGMSWMRI